MNSLKKINWTTYINIIILALIYILSVLIKSTSLIYTANFILIGSLSFVILNRVTNSFNILRKLSELQEVDFPKYKDISTVVLGNFLLVTTYLSLVFGSIGIIDISKPIGDVTVDAKIILFLSIFILAIFAFFSSASGIIVTPCVNKGSKIFLISEDNGSYSNEIFNRATGSFKEGIIIGYYVFYFKDITLVYKDKLGNIIIEGNNGSPFKIEIVAKRSKEYFSKILDI